MNEAYRIKRISQIGELDCLVEIEVSPEACWTETWTIQALEKYLNDACGAGLLTVDALHAPAGYL